MVNSPTTTITMRRSVQLALCLAAFTFSTVAAAAKYESIADVRQQVQQFIDTYDFGSENRVVASVGKIDTRLRLHKCQDQLDIYFASEAQGPGRTFLGVQCHTGKPWNIYVSANVDMFADVLVSKKSLLRGQSVNASDVGIETRKLSTLRTGYFVGLEQLENMQVARTVQRGQVITPALLKPQFLVKRGERVTLVANAGGIKVRMKGKALADATSNGRVRVKNDSSGRVVEGIVTARGVVEIPL